MFYDKVARPMQWLKPQDAARDMTTPIYRKLRAGISKWLGNKRKLAEALSHANKLKDAFIKAGGTLVNSSWILGYRVVKSAGVKKLIQFQFDPVATNNKGPAFVWLTDKEITEFVTSHSPGEWYLDNVAFARNGTGGDNQLNALFATLGAGAGAAGLLPIQFLRSVRSIVSTVSRTGVGFAQKGFLGFFQDYFSNFGQKIVSNAITRGGRLVGLAAGSTVGSSLIRREVQRTTNLFLGRGLKNLIRGEAFTSGLTTQRISRQYLTAGITQVRSVGGRKLGRGITSSSSVLQTQAVTRNFNIFSGTLTSPFQGKFKPRVNLPNPYKIKT